MTDKDHLAATATTPTLVSAPWYSNVLTVCPRFPDGVGSIGTIAATAPEPPNAVKGSQSERRIMAKPCFKAVHAIIEVPAAPTVTAAKCTNHH